MDAKQKIYGPTLIMRQMITKKHQYFVRGQ